MVKIYFGVDVEGCSKCKELPSIEAAQNYLKMLYPGKAAFIEKFKVSRSGETECVAAYELDGTLIKSI